MAGSLSGGHWGKLSKSEFQRLADGKFRVGDFVWSAEQRSVGGQIESIGRVGTKRSGYDAYLVSSPRGLQAIRIGQAVAGGIPGGKRG